MELYCVVFVLQFENVLFYSNVHVSFSGDENISLTQYL